MTLLSVVESNSIRFYTDHPNTTVPNIDVWNCLRAGYNSDRTMWWYDEQPLRVGEIQNLNSGGRQTDASLQRPFMAFDVPDVIPFTATLKLVFTNTDADFKLYVVALDGRPATATANWTSQWVGKPILGSIVGVSSVETNIEFNSTGISYLDSHRGQRIYLGLMLQADYDNLFSPTSDSQNQDVFTVVGLEVGSYCSVDFSGTPLVGEAPVESTFTDETDVSPGLSILTWLWNFGDGSTSSVQNPTHTFTNPGFYIVSLTVGLDNGYTETKTVWKYVTATGNALGEVLPGPEGTGSERSRGGVVLMPGLTESPIDHNQLVLNDTLLTVLLKALKTNILSERARGGVVRLIGMLMATKTGGAFPYGSYPHSFHIGSVDFGVNIETKFIESSFIGRMFNSNDRFRTYDDSWYWIEKFHYDNCLITDSELREGICWREIEDTITLTELDFTTITRLYIADYIIRVGEENRYGESVENPTLRGEFDREGLNGD